MNPKQAEEIIDKLPHRPRDFKPLLYLKYAWKEISSVSAFFGLVAYALTKIGFLTPNIEGAIIIVAITLSAAVAVSILLHRAIKTEFKKVIATIHLDRDPAQHTIDSHFKNFLPVGDISILQTWIPEGMYEPEGYVRIKRWQKYLQDAIVCNRNIVKSPIRLRALLLGSEEGLKNRIRYRWDLAQKHNASYPFLNDKLDDAVVKAKERIEEIHKSLIRLESGIQEYLRNQDLYAIDFRVSIRYYRVIPCGPIYIFGKQALLTGFYDPRWTSDRAPAVRLENHRSVEWIYFSTLFDCIWCLRDPETFEKIPTNNEETLYTTYAPSWRKEAI